jgi:tetratricopeptide (TPR) repeat protein
MSERYRFNSQDREILEAATALLRKAASTEITKPAELASIAKLQHVLATLPRVTSDVNVTVSVISPRRKFGEIEIFHWWDIAIDDECLSISSGGHFYRPSTGGDSFSTMKWAAVPSERAEFDDYRDSLGIVPDICSFPEAVAGIDLSSPGFKIEVSDEDNPLLDVDDEDVDEEADESSTEDEDELIEEHADEKARNDQIDLFNTNTVDQRSHDSRALQPDMRFNERALELLHQDRFDEARIVLEEALRKMPAGWKPVNESSNSVQIAFWDEDEFFAHTGHITSRPLEKSIFWVPGSYSHAWHILAVIASKQNQPERALFCLDCGLELEPDHPDHWSEKGFVLGKLKRHGEALQCYIRAATIREWAPAVQIARALRGQGVQLVDLERLNDAEVALQRSLEFEPGNNLALQELEYVQQLREDQAKRKKELPWFMRALVEPPTDPLTVQLMTLVEELPDIPGPKTVGPDNYSRISDAFMQRGWPGFEEEFERIVPRTRPDYEQVKRDILCESIFSAKVHRNMTRAFMAGTGNSEETFEDVMNDIFKHRDARKPQ